MRIALIYTRLRVEERMLLDALEEPGSAVTVEPVDVRAESSDWPAAAPPAPGRGWPCGTVVDEAEHDPPLPCRPFLLFFFFFFFFFFFPSVSHKNIHIY